MIFNILYRSLVPSAVFYLDISWGTFPPFVSSSPQSAPSLYGLRRLGPPASPGSLHFSYSGPGLDKSLFFQCCDHETTVSKLGCTRVHLAKVSVSRPCHPGLSLSLEFRVLLKKVLTDNNIGINAARTTKRTSLSKPSSDSSITSVLMDLPDLSSFNTCMYFIACNKQSILKAKTGTRSGR